MSDTVAVKSEGGLGLSGVLAVAFITLKILGLISWSWVWVLSPLWIPLAFVALVLVFIAVGFLMSWAIS